MRGRDRGSPAKRAQRRGQPARDLWRGRSRRGRRERGLASGLPRRAVRNPVRRNSRRWSAGRRSPCRAKSVRYGTRERRRSWPRAQLVEVEFEARLLLDFEARLEIESYPVQGGRNQRPHYGASARDKVLSAGDSCPARRGPPKDREIPSCALDARAVPRTRARARAQSFALRAPTAMLLSMA